MADVKSAYEVLGLKEGASKDEIEKRFAVLLKKCRTTVPESNETGSSGDDGIEEITKAYNLLMGYEEQDAQEEVSKKPNPLYGKLGLDEKKTKNFLYYYKFHIIGGIVLIALLISLINSIVTKKNPDVNVAFIGSIFYQDSEPFKAEILEKIPEFEEVGIDGITIYDGMDGESEYYANMKVTVLFAAADTDIFLMDKSNYLKYAQSNDGAFTSLDELTGELNIDTSKNEDLIVKPDEGSEKHLYGVDVSDCLLFKEANISGDQIIAAIRVNPKHYDNAIKLMKLLLSTK